MTLFCALNRYNYFVLRISMKFLGVFGLSNALLLYVRHMQFMTQNTLQTCFKHVLTKPSCFVVI